MMGKERFLKVVSGLEKMSHLTRNSEMRVDKIFQS